MIAGDQPNVRDDTLWRLERYEITRPSFRSGAEPLDDHLACRGGHFSGPRGWYGKASAVKEKAPILAGTRSGLSGRYPYGESLVSRASGDAQELRETGPERKCEIGEPFIDLLRSPCLALPGLALPCLACRAKPGLALPGRA